MPRTATVQVLKEQTAPGAPMIIRVVVNGVLFGLLKNGYVCQVGKAYRIDEKWVGAYSWKGDEVRHIETAEALVAFALDHTDDD